MVGGRGLQMAVAFVSNLALVRLLTPSDFGHFAIVAANVGIVSSVVNCRLEDVLLRLPASDLSAERLSVFGSALALEMGLIALGSVGLLGFLDMLDLDALLLIVGSAAGSWVSAQSALFEREFEYRELSVVQTTSQITAQILAVGGAALGLGAIVLYARELLKVFGTGVGLGVMGKLRALPIRVLRSADWRLLWDRVRGFWGDGLLEHSFDRLVILATGLLVSDRVIGYFYQARFLAGVPGSLLAPFTFRIRMNQLAHHTEDDARESATLRSLGLTLVPLLGATGVALWLADPVIPWLFGSGWEGMVPLFVAMLGLIPGLTLMDTVKAHYMAEGEMGAFLWIGRGSQYVSALATAGVALLGGVDPASSLAYGLSAAYLIPVAALVVALLLRRRRTRDSGLLERAAE